VPVLVAFQDWLVLVSNGPNILRKIVGPELEIAQKLFFVDYRNIELVGFALG